jgi:hypothetical protein
MLNSAPGAMIKYIKREIKEKLNIEKTTFYISNVLNAHISR